MESALHQQSYTMGILPAKAALNSLLRVDRPSPGGLSEPSARFILPNERDLQYPRGRGKHMTHAYIFFSAACMRVTGDG